MNKMIMTSLSIDELKEAIRDVLKQELNGKKEKDLMSFKETQEFLGISQSCLNQWKAQSKIPYKRISKKIFFSRVDIMTVLKDAGNYKILQDIEKK